MPDHFRVKATYGLAILISIIPLLFINTPPLVDYGGHLGRMAIQLDAGNSPYLSQWYSFKWGLVSNLGTDLLVQAIGPWLGVEAALRWVLIATVAIQASGYVFLSRVVHGRTSPTVILALVMIYNIAFHYGFLNFLLAAALATWSIGLWIKLGADQRIWLRAALFAFIAPLLWVTHLVGWALLLVYAGSDELVRNYQRYGRSYRTITACIAPCLTLLVPTLFYAFDLLATSEVGVTGYLFWWSKPLHLLRALRDSSAPWDIASILFLLSCLYLMGRSQKFCFHHGLLLGSAILFLIFIVMPGQILGSALADMRLAPFFIAVALIAARPKSKMKHWKITAFTALSATFLLIRIAGTTASLQAEELQVKQDLAILNNVPRGTNLLSLVVTPCDELTNWKLDRRGNLPAYAIVRRHAFSNAQWTMSGGQLLSVRNPAAGAFTIDPSQSATVETCEGFVSLAEKFAIFPDDIRYLWVIAPPTLAPIKGWTIVASSGRSILYRR